MTENERAAAMAELRSNECADPIQREALDLQRETLSNTHRQTIFSMHILADLLDSNHIPYRMKAAEKILALTPLGRGRSPVGPYLPWGPG